jgi:hypothetical protein
MRTRRSLSPGPLLATAFLIVTRFSGSRAPLVGRGGARTVPVPATAAGAMVDVRLTKLHDWIE